MLNFIYILLFSNFNCWYRICRRN